MVKGFLIVAQLVFVGRPVAAAAQDVVVTSDKIKGLMEEKNGKMTAARLEAESSKDREISLSSSFLPTLELSGTKENTKTGSATATQGTIWGVEARLNLFNGGRDAIKEELRSLETARREVKAKRITAEELADARALYWQILYLKEKVSLLKTALDINKQNLISAQRRIKSGVAANSDRFEFEIKETDLKSELAQVEGDLNSHTAIFRVVLGLDDGAKLTLSEPFIHNHDDGAVSNPTSSQFDFLVREHEILGRQYLLSAKENRRAWWPKFDLFAKYNKSAERYQSQTQDTKTGTASETQVGVSLTLDLQDGRRLSREAGALEKEAAAANLLSDQERREIAAHIAGEVAQLKILHDLVHEAEQNILRAERYYQITQSEYTRGVKNSPDVLGAADKLFDIRHNRLKIIKEFQISKSHLLSKIGL